ncbi:MAG: hypothetical protein FJ117_13575 [Deltaproteobacteria bacterium]|nr:hypothetical protein [Deltaproteobacteria bacterium]
MQKMHRRMRKKGITFEKTQSTLCTNVPYSRGWANLLDKRLGGHERLILYAEGIEKMNVNKNIPQLFRDIFKGGEKGDGGSKTTCERGDIRHIQKLLKVIHSERGERDVRAERV